MKRRMALTALLAVALLPIPGYTAAQKPPPAATVSAVKPPIKLTLRLYKKTVKLEKSLWYTIELKNVGKKRIPLDDKIFKDHWAMHENCRLRSGIYLEVIGPDGKSAEVRPGGGAVKWDYMGEPGTIGDLDPKDEADFLAKQAEWKRKGLTPHEIALEKMKWEDAWNTKEEYKERDDPARQAWLAPGASTRTLTWAYRDPSQYADRSFEEKRAGDYTELWSYLLWQPGKHRIRAVYHYSISKELLKKHNETPEAWWINVRTPFIDFEVQP